MPLFLRLRLCWAIALGAAGLPACGSDDTDSAPSPVYDGPILARAPVELPTDDVAEDGPPDNPWLTGLVGAEPEAPSGDAPETPEDPPKPEGSGGGDSAPSDPATPPEPARLLLTRYYEGLGNDKALEITNLGDEAVDLSRCRLATYVNGNTSPYRNSALSGSLAAGASLLLCGTATSDPLLGYCQGTSSAIAYNGNDAVLLSCDGQLMDSFGRLGEDPGTSWMSNGVGTVNSHLVRLCSAEGDTVADDAFDPSLEWRSLPLDDLSTLGARFCPDPNDGILPIDENWEPLEPAALLCPEDELLGEDE